MNPCEELRQCAAYEDMLITGEYSDEGFLKKISRGDQKFSGCWLTSKTIVLLLHQNENGLKKQNRNGNAPLLWILGGIDMKLAEARILRADLQNRLEQLRERLTMNAKV